MQERSGELRRQGKAIAFVPTMGFLHEGHLSLMREGKRRGGTLVVSIFVNPTQFAPNEDFDSYPRDFDRDIELARSVGVDIVFSPNRKDLYPKGFETHVKLDALSRHLCGLSRPVFFSGVATVVTKLFNIVLPTIAVFGEKDFQQLVIIRRMVQDLNMNITIIGGPTVREPDGLAMSSRNAYLRPRQWEAALSLYRSLTRAREQVREGLRDTAEIIQTATDFISEHPETKIDYIAVVDAETLVDVKRIDRPTRMVLAVKVGETRLIDNIELGTRQE